MKFRVLVKTWKNIWILSGLGALLTLIGISKDVSIAPADQICLGIMLILWAIVSGIASRQKTERLYSLWWQIIFLIVLFSVCVITFFNFRGMF
ncbi:MAG: hypothetical protein OXI43_12385 [Candidatus Poribacteria bacterium]|nr:hypothetical protein [Candidatus Poribacteria bacterium]